MQKIIFLTCFVLEITRGSNFFLQDNVSFTMHPKYLTLKCCLICISPYFIFSFLTFFYFEFSRKKYRLKFVIAKMDT